MVLLNHAPLLFLSPEPGGTPKALRRKGSVARGLLDDGQPLPAVPRLPLQGGSIPGLGLRVIQDEHDPAHRIWNRLIVWRHPLGRRPSVGTQLRYLVEGEAGIVGAFRFGPSAIHLDVGISGLAGAPKPASRTGERSLDCGAF